MKDKNQEMVRIDAEQMEMLRHYSELSGVPIAATMREIVGEWIEGVYPARIRMFAKMEKAAKLSRIKLARKA
jgi:hypothetical protein